MAPIASSSRAPPPPIEHSPGPDPLSEAEVDEDPFENFHIEPVCAVKLNNLVGDFDKVLDSITHGMQRGTETACELEEVQEAEQVEKIEFSIRTYIDLENRLKIEKAAMENLRDRIKGGEKIKNLVAEYQTAVQRATDEYENQPEAAKYFGNEAFVDFKQKVWEVHHPDQEMPPLNPRPVDDDLVIGTQRVSLKCPITQTLLVNPVTSKICKHSFSRDAVTQMIGQNGGHIGCPESGCDKILTMNELAPNSVLARKVKRVKDTWEDDEEEDAGKYVDIE